MDLDLAGLTAGRRFAIVTSEGLGAAVVPAGRCAGLLLDIEPAGLRLRDIRSADGVGAGSLSPTIPRAACHLAVQAIDLSACAVTNAEFIAQFPIVEGLVAWFPLDNSATDLGGHGHDGAMAGLPVTDRRGDVMGALAFDGTDDVVVVPDDPALRLPTEVTLAAWVRRTRDDIDMIVEKGGDWTTTANYGMALHSSVYESMFYMTWHGGWAGAAQTPDLEWHHYAVTAIDGAAAPKLYVDGEPQTLTDSYGATVTLNPSTAPLHIGAQPEYGYFSGNQIDDVLLYERALLPSEIGQLASAL
jgi:hypothetical protein